MTAERHGSGAWRGGVPCPESGDDLAACRGMHTVALKGRGNPTRKSLDCRDLASETNCTLVISGRELEVLQAGAEHTLSTHGYVGGPERRRQLQAMMTDEVTTRV